MQCQMILFFFSSRRRHTRSTRDWSSDVCSSDLMPVNLVMVAEGEEEIGSPHIPQLVRRPEVLAALKKCDGVFMPSATQDLDGIVTVNLGSKGVIELELVSSGEKWGRGPAKDIHSSLKAIVDSPPWH